MAVAEILKIFEKKKPIEELPRFLGLTDCRGCGGSLRVGWVPDDPFIPLPGINVWLPHLNGPKPLTSRPDKFINDRRQNQLNVCVDCFNGYVTGKRKISPENLGITIIKAPYSNKEKFLKIDGPTKLVNLLTDEQKKEIEANSKIECPKPTTRRRKICDDSKNDDEVKEVIANRPELEIIEVPPRIPTLNLGAPTTVNYLTIGRDLLGAMEMTDD